jgi:ectoine hydroxylase-related dioxygenase (phytanoyl-CoA dioxygenase family)
MVKQKTINKNNINYDIIPIFPLPIYKTNIEREFTKEEQDEFDVIISDQSKKAEARVEVEKIISIDKYVLNRKTFLSIHSFIQLHLKEFVATVLGIDIKKTNWSPHITMSWLNAYKPNHYDPFHNHRNCIISGVLYINCLKNLAPGKSDGIVFQNLSHNMIEDLDCRTAVVEDTLFTDKPYQVHTIEGDLVLFPSTTMHAVNHNETFDQTRISLAIDVI